MARRKGKGRKGKGRKPVHTQMQNPFGGRMKRGRGKKSR